MRSSLKPVPLKIERLARGQERLDLRPPSDCLVRVENKNRRILIRRGLNQNAGIPQKEVFILRKDGSIIGGIDRDYDVVTNITAQPIDPEPLVLRGGIFKRIANRMRQEAGYNYWGRNNFGYPCFMPRVIRIEGLFVDDSKHAENHHGVVLFNDIIAGSDPGRPFPYRLTERLEVSGLKTASGLPPRVGSNPEVAKAIKVIARAAQSSGGQPE